ncbi:MULTISPECIES: LysR family transcriptional regulator [Citrobacter]|uniref:LysR family transcriptional regulator n=1 Tax=Citrobacter murliniae TaxID=67829 RepID=A0ABY2PUE0_9ENTR|nr:MULTISPECIES: LysR family transcriptional regulator [Citrobacter]HEB0853094.1 LysR family transcriptional regulator [Citrobacter freundii]KLV62748.1 hypothetical protein SK36_02766 [Citrobacter sp. MGH106]MBJ9597079.1 LysR family transcriptional regulator [Citrobacter werkmanii]MBJ9872198.1 LysR family transcriptional regulator [Citrobacter werkmanii]MDM2928263.1 LysR family transcriptional regulator [Citrobacter sp. Cm046]
MKFTLRQLEFYIALAETLQISKAAARCHISQSSMTIAMRNLEEALDAQLFVRYPKGVKLTAEGERFLAHACNIINSSRAAVDALHDRSDLLCGTVRIGVAETLSAYLIPDILDDIERRFPLLEIIFHEDTAPELVQALRQKNVDFCLLLTSNISHDADLKIETFIRSQRRLWSSIGHPLQSQPAIRLKDVVKLPFLLLETDKYPDVITDYWQQRGYAPDICFRSNSFEAIRSLVAKGRGITILSDLVYRPWSLDGLRVMRRTIDDFITYMDVGTVTNANQPLTTETRRVIDFLRQAITRLDSSF